MPSRYDFFIAHASADKPAARSLARALEALKCSVFLDEQLPPGTEWPVAIPDALRDSKTVLALVSGTPPTRGPGHYFRSELVAAIKGFRAGTKGVVPIYLKGQVEPDEVPYGLEGLTGLFFERDGGATGVAARLVRAVSPDPGLQAALDDLDDRLTQDPTNPALRHQRQAIRTQMTTAHELAVGDDFTHRYELKEKIGAGGFGQVWRAFDRTTRRAVALKILHRDLGDRHRSRFATGLRRMSGFEHPHIVRLLDGPHEHQGRIFAALELMESDLAQALDRGAILPDQVPTLVRGIAAGLDHAHQQGVVHRDIKPANILLTSGHPKLTDFDLVHVEDTGRKTRTRALGTLAYVAPELLRAGAKVTPAADQFGLAMTAACMYRGQCLEHDPDFDVFEREAWLEELAVPDGVRAVLRRGIAKKPEQRWPGVMAFAEALAGAMKGPGESPPGTAGFQPATGLDKPGGPPETTGQQTHGHLKPTKASPAATMTQSQPTGLPGLVMVPVPGGTFLMGSPPGVGREVERPQHSVTLSPFLMSATVVTQAQYQAVTSANPSRFKGDGRPVEQVSWVEAVDFCNALSRREGLGPAYDAQRTLLPHTNGYRLPTEAQWEYACRAGTTTRWFHGDEEAGLEEYAWYGKNSGRETHPVAQKNPNAFGLFDMHGNVWEWCHDWLGAYPSAPKTDPLGASRGGRRVLRGGSYWGGADRCRSAYRSGVPPGFRDGNLGFRLVRPAPPLLIDH